jgi:broad specificity phosphatase PhoE
MMDQRRAVVVRGRQAAATSPIAALLHEKIPSSLRVSAGSVAEMLDKAGGSTLSPQVAEQSCFDLASSLCESGFVPIVDGGFADGEWLAGQVLRFERRGIRLCVVTLIADGDGSREHDAARRIEDSPRLSPIDDVPGVAVTMQGASLDQVLADVIEAIERDRPPSPPASPDHGPVDVLFLRHGAPDYPVEVYPDPFVMPLSAQGRAEAVAARAAVRRFDPDVVVASDFRRAVETAELAVAGLGKPIQIAAELRERVFYELVGKPFADIRRDLGDRAAGVLAGNSDLLSLDSEETYPVARKRLVDYFDGLIRRYAGRRVLIVAHGGPHSWLVEHALGVDLMGSRALRWDTGCFSRFTISKEEIKIGGLNLPPSAVVRGLRLGSV